MRRRRDQVERETRDESEDQKAFDTHINHFQALNAVHVEPRIHDATIFAELHGAGPELDGMDKLATSQSEASVTKGSPNAMPFAL